MRYVVRAVLVLGLIAVGLMVFLGWQDSNREGELAFARASVDFGQVPLNQKVPYRFQMRNVGSKPVKIIGTPKIEAVEGC